MAPPPLAALLNASKREETEMGSMIDFGAVREGREELARQVARERLASSLRSHRSGPRPLNVIAGRLVARMSGGQLAAR